MNWPASVVFVGEADARSEVHQVADPISISNIKIGRVGTRVDGPRAGTANIVINWQFSDTRESLASTLEHGALTSITGKTAPDAATTVSTTRTVFESVILGQRTLADAMEHREITTTGDVKAVSDLFALLVDFESGFPVVEPGR